MTKMILNQKEKSVTFVTGKFRDTLVSLIPGVSHGRIQVTNDVIWTNL